MSYIYFRLQHVRKKRKKEKLVYASFDAKKIFVFYYSASLEYSFYFYIKTNLFNSIFHQISFSKILKYDIFENTE